ncbi:YD repeat-containing protein [Pseudomonas amygdali pv. aesculi str. 0893_23]|uniref:RHS repeat-associated core domain-containing protein n=1 Tax=Pseudomonas syringae group genomosp. 2 TaxID=251698 RepID=UPI0001CC3F4D|nr:MULTISPECIES: RHS repeat-associated core domain-containing protein [Pseudomonas syringae group genomosp. 2]EGH00361.1 YD repeat-containing protein [Pseudomonas amygdali pv. aesculi str. 0893_23]KPW25502.1 YD repeat-containing protein [Pseudomonas amygdali pv. aesculi]MCQ3009729.1 RHS repeat-associated core domain-containing protein [Pseudomonas savastanoi]
MALLCTYTYDPLDRVSTLNPLAQVLSSRFYNGEQLMTELQGDRQRTCIRAGGQLLAQQSREGEEVVTTMVASDLHNSVLHASEDGRQVDIAYTPFGHRQAEQAIAELPGFNGEQPDLVTGHYLLGNGYRAYNPVLMRFNSPDSFSPFGDGGLNAYAYGLNNPIKYIDPTGHFSSFLSGVLAAGLLLTGGGSIYVSTHVKESNPTLSGVLMGVGSVLAVAGVGFALSSIVKKAAGVGRSTSRLESFGLARQNQRPAGRNSLIFPNQRPPQSSADLPAASFALPRPRLLPSSVAPARSATIRRTGYPKYRNIRRPVFQKYLYEVDRMPTISEQPSHSIRGGHESVV